MLCYAFDVDIHTDAPISQKVPNLIMTTVPQLFMVSLLVASHILPSATNKNRTLNLLCLLPYTEPPLYPSFSDGPQIRLALEMAKNEINNQSVILPDYRIELIHANSACQFTDKAYEALLRNVYSQFTTQNIIGLIGPGCSLGSTAVGSLISRNELSLVTVHSGGSFELADRIRFPNTLGALGSAEDFAQIVLQLMIKHNWQNVNLLFEETRRFYSSITQRIVTLTSSFNTLTTAIDQTYLPLEQEVFKNLRIKFLLTAKDVTQRVLCLARHLGMVYPAYQWIIFVNTFEEIATDVSFYYQDRYYTCTENEMKSIALNRGLFLVYQLSAINETLPSTHSKHTFQEYDQIIRKGINEYNLQNVTNLIEYSVWTSYFYDSLWAWSVVLDQLTKRHPTMDFTLSNYGNTMLTSMILEEFYDLDFEGVSGRINFCNKSGFVQRPVAVLQVFDSTPQSVAFLMNGNELTGNVASISDQFGAVNLHMSNEVVGIIITIALVQLIILVTLNVLTFIYRKYPSVKASSLKLNQLIFIGCYLFVLTIIIFTVSQLVDGLPLVTKILCNITWSWLLPLSLTLSLGPVAVRTWRLYRIFTHYLHPGRFIADRYLVGFVFILFGFDLIIGTLLGVFNDQIVQELRIPIMIENATFQKILICYSERPWLNAVLLFGYKGLLMLAVLVLTLLTRNIKNSSFSTKSLQILIYLVSLVMVVGFILYYLLFTRPTSRGAFYSFVLTLDVVLMLFIGLVCVPPLLPKLKDKYWQFKPKFMSWNVELSS